MPDNNLCPPEPLARIMAAVSADQARGLVEIDAGLRRHPADPRLRFLRGSVLAGLERYDEAREAMALAVELAPDFAVARFQLGFLELTCGAAAAAEATWGPLDALPDTHYLRVLARGLRHLMRDEFAEAAAGLRRGMALNTENPALNGDMQLILDKLSADGLIDGAAKEPVSAAHLLLQRYSDKGGLN